MTPDSPACTCQVLGTTGVHYHGEENHLLNTVLWLLHVTVHAFPHTPATRQIKEWHAGQPHGLAGRGACYQFCWAGVQPPQCTKYQERADLYKLSSDRHISTVAGTCSPNQPFLKNECHRHQGNPAGTSIPCYLPPPKYTLSKQHGPTEPVFMADSWRTGSDGPRDLVLAEDPGSILSTHAAAHNCLYNSSSRGSDTLF